MAVAQRRRRVDDLVEGAGDEVAELHLEHRTHPQDRRADSGADNQRLRDRRVDYALFAERLE